MPLSPDSAGLNSRASEARVLDDLAQIECQPLPQPLSETSSEKVRFSTRVSRSSHWLNLPSGKTTYVAYELPNTGYFNVSVGSLVTDTRGSTKTAGQNKETLFYPEIVLLDKQRRIVRTIGGSQVKYRKPGFITPEGIGASFVVDNRVSPRAACMLVYTTDELQKGKTRLMNEAKEYARVHGVVPPPVPDTFARHGITGELTFIVRPVETMPPVSQPLSSAAQIPAFSSGASALPIKDPFSETVRSHYVEGVKNALAEKAVTKAMDLRDELQVIIRAAESCFARHYMSAKKGNRKVSPMNPLPKGVESGRFAGKAITHYHIEIEQYLKAGEAAPALQLMDDLKDIRDEMNRQFNLEYSPGN